MKLPPFGRILLAYQQDSIPLDPTIYIFIGKNGFNDAKAHLQLGTLATCLPYGENFTDYNWPIKDQKVILADSDHITLNHLKLFGMHLLRCEPRILAIHSTHHQYFELVSDKEDFYGKK